MGDDKTNRSVQDSKHIDLNERYERRNWSKRLGVPEEELITAVRAVGGDAEKVREYLKHRQQRKGAHRVG